MNIYDLDLSKLRKVKPVLSKEEPEGLAVLAWDLMRQPKTTMYLLNEFECQEIKMAVCIVQYWDGFKGKYVRTITVTKPCMYK